MDPIKKVLTRLRSKRDLRAEMLALAADVAESSTNRGQLILIAPTVSLKTARREWQRLLSVIHPELRDRLQLIIEDQPAGMVPGDDTPNRPGKLLRFDRPNYRYEVLRLLIARGSRRGPTIRELTDAIDASQTPVLRALAELRAAELIVGTKVQVPQITSDRLAKVGALPQTMRFRFERGARLKSPTELLERALILLSERGPEAWNDVSLSGVAVAQQEVPDLDIVGLPRLDLLITAPRSRPAVDANLLRRLDDGLEPEPNPLAPAPVVMTVVRARTDLHRTGPVANGRCAATCDVFLSLVDLGLREQALHYLRSVTR